MSKELFDQVSIRCSQLTTETYSTSFSLGIRCLNKKIQKPIYAIYGFVRFADEIVDSFHHYDKKKLIDRFRNETDQAIADKISLNPILNSFQRVVHQYGIEEELYNQFFTSMEMDLNLYRHDHSTISEYVLGSAEVVGLMTLRVFCNNEESMYLRLKPFAMKLGSAFQKINFLRDIYADYSILGRNYFPEIDISCFDEEAKDKIEQDIAADFQIGYQGIKELPSQAKLGVYVAYLYYMELFKKIKNTPARIILKKRISVHYTKKIGLLVYSIIKNKLRLI